MPGPSDVSPVHSAPALVPPPGAPVLHDEGFGGDDAGRPRAQQPAHRVQHARVQVTERHAADVSLQGLVAREAVSAAVLQPDAVTSGHDGHVC